MVKRGPCARRPGHFQVFAEPATSLRPRVLAGRSNIFLPFTRTAGMPRGLGQAASFGLGFATWTRAMGPGYRAVSFLPCLCLGFSICQQQQQQQQQQVHSRAMCTCVQGSEEGVEFFGTVVTDTCEPPHVGAGNSTWILQAGTRQ